MRQFGATALRRLPGQCRCETCPRRSGIGCSRGVSYHWVTHLIELRGESDERLPSTHGNASRNSTE
jgi:hypothetical protein